MFRAIKQFIKKKYIEHVESPSVYIDECHRVMGERSILYVVSPNRFSYAKEPHYGLRLFRVYPRYLANQPIPLINPGFHG